MSKKHRFTKPHVYFKNMYVVRMPDIYDQLTEGHTQTPKISLKRFIILPNHPYNKSANVIRVLMKSIGHPSSSVNHVLRDARSNNLKTDQITNINNKK